MSSRRVIFVALAAFATIPVLGLSENGIAVAKTTSMYASVPPHAISSTPTEDVASRLEAGP
ncbi:MAG TPA: hypothetical protein VNJ51_09800 [Candidatus Dormibacteraeota bacterium]|nr:hypothetical protein [Candidatus Dormibacteraeota bacterium]